MKTKGKWLSHREVQKALFRHDEPFLLAWQQGQLEVELYEPRDKDLQTPHTRDEIYVVVTGSGDFFCSGDSKPFEPGDVLFAPAGAEHRFLNFSDDFSVWVIFYGPEGGETL